MSENTDKCGWFIDCDYWESTCKEAAFRFDDEGPTGNGFKFCPHCGKELIEIDHPRKDTQ